MRTKPSALASKQKVQPVRTPEIVAVLGANEIFGVLDEKTRTLLAERSRVHTHRKGQTVLVEGEYGNQVFLIIRGGVRVYRQSPSGSVIELTRKVVGETFGEIAVLDDVPRSASVDATALTTLISIERDVFLGILEREPSTINPLMRVLGRMVRHTAGLATDLAFLDIKARLAARILTLIDRLDNDAQALTHRHRVSQVELAQMVGGARQTVNVALHALEDDGYISLDIDGIRIVDRHKLELLISGRV